MEYHFTQILQPCWELMRGVDLVKIPRVSQTITCPVPGGRFPELNVCGHDYPTKDGNGAFEKASDKKIPVKLCPRKPGNAPNVYAPTEKAEKELGWKEKYGRGGDVQRTMLMGSLHKLFQINPRRMDHSNYGELFLHDFDFDLIGGIVGLFATHPYSDLLSSSWKSLSLSAKHIKIRTSLSILKWKPKGSCAE